MKTIITVMTTICGMGCVVAYHNNDIIATMTISFMFGLFSGILLSIFISDAHDEENS